MAKKSEAKKSEAKKPAETKAPKPTRKELEAKAKKAGVKSPKYTDKAELAAQIESQVDPSQKYLFKTASGEFVGSLNAQGDDKWPSITVYEVQNGVMTDRRIDCPDASVYEKTPLTTAEVFAKLGL